MKKKIFIIPGVFVLLLISACFVYSGAYDTYTTSYTDYVTKTKTETKSVACDASKWTYKDLCICNGNFKIGNGCASGAGCGLYAKHGSNSACGQSYCTNDPAPTSGTKSVTTTYLDPVTKYNCHYINGITWGACVETSAGSGVGEAYPTGVTWASTGGKSCSNVEAIPDGLYPWSLQGEVLGCCGDVGSEFYITEKAAPKAPLDFQGSEQGCCDTTGDCFNDVSCFTSGSTSGVFPNEGFCKSRIWYGGDDTKEACEEIAGAGLWNLGGVSMCCGDDVSEYVNYQAEEDTTPKGDIEWITIPDSACCSNLADNVGAANNCVKSEIPVDGSAVDTGSVAEDLKGISSTDGVTSGWMECDLYADNLCNNLGNGSYSLAGEHGVGEYEVGSISNGGRITEGSNEFGYAETCGDDANEYLINSFTYGANGVFIAGPYSACCNTATDCVNSTGHCVDTNTPGTSPNELHCSNNNWTKCDTFYFENCKMSGTFDCTYDGVLETCGNRDPVPGETCGDDIDNDCDGAVDGFDTECSFINGTIYEEITEAVASSLDITEKVDGKYYRVSNGANITLKYFSDLSDPINGYGKRLTNEKGQFNISIDEDRKAVVNYVKVGERLNVPGTFLKGTDYLNLKIYLSYESECTERCSIVNDKGNFVCDKSCEGRNGCAFGSEDVRDACIGAEEGWQRSYTSGGETYSVLCCTTNQGPAVLNERKPLEVESDIDVKGLITHSRIINYKGEMVTMYITTWDES